jgi:hypothetical protein
MIFYFSAGGAPIMPTDPREYLWPGIVAAQAICVDEKMHHRGHGAA